MIVCGMIFWMRCFRREPPLLPQGVPLCGDREVAISVRERFFLEPLPKVSSARRLNEMPDGEIDESAPVALAGDLIEDRHSLVR